MIKVYSNVKSTKVDLTTLNDIIQFDKQNMSDILQNNNRVFNKYDRLINILECLDNGHLICYYNKTISQYILFNELSNNEIRINSLQINQNLRIFNKKLLGYMLIYIESTKPDTFFTSIVFKNNKQSIKLHQHFKFEKIDEINDKIKYSITKRKLIAYLKKFKL